MKDNHPWRMDSKEVHPSDISQETHPNTKTTFSVKERLIVDRVASLLNSASPKKQRAVLQEFVQQLPNQELLEYISAISYELMLHPQSELVRYPFILEVLHRVRDRRT